MGGDAGQGTVVVTGAAGNLGRLVVQALHRTRTVLAVDRRPFHGLPKDVEHLKIDVRRRAIEDAFRTRSVRAILHLGLNRSPRPDNAGYRFNVVGTQRLLDLAARYRVDTFIMLSTATIYGPDPDNSYFLNEETPLLGAEHHSQIRDLVAVDNIVQSFFYRHPEVRTVMLRPVHIVGSRVRNAASNYLRLERPWVLAGFDPMIQLIHEEDVVRALVVALEREVRGVYNIVGPGVAPLSRILRVLGRRPLVIPSFMARRILSSAWRVHASGFPSPELRHIQFNCIVDGTAARRDLGFEPRYNLIETIRAVTETAFSV